MARPSALTNAGGRSSLRSVVRLLVLGLVALVLVEAVATAVVRVVVSNAQRDLSDHIRPAQQASSQLYRAFVDQETGQRGFLLTGQGSFLQPYEAGQRQVAVLESRLRGALHDRRYQSAIAAAVAAGDRWRRQAAEPEIAARRAGLIRPAQALAMALLGKKLFDQLRQRLDAVTARADALARAKLNVMHSAQQAAGIVSIIAVVLALAVALAAPLILRRVLDRPLRRLMGQLQAVSDDSEAATITPEGPGELQAIAAAAEKMRAALVRNAIDLVDVERRLTVVAERDRISAELHDHTIQQIYGMGLALTAMASRADPTVRADLERLTSESDEIIRKLRRIILDIRDTDDVDNLRVAASIMTREAGWALGFHPAFEVRGLVEVPNREVREAALAALREMLTNVARHAHASHATVRLAMTDGQLAVEVHDDGVGMTATSVRGNGLTDLADQAARFGGGFSIEPAKPTGTAASWRVPISAIEPLVTQGAISGPALRAHEHIW
jgi:signal transduction histidine kinase